MIPHGSYCDAPSAGSQSASPFSLEDLAWASMHKQENKQTRHDNVKGRHSPEGGRLHLHFKWTRTQSFKEKSLPSDKMIADRREEE